MLSYSESFCASLKHFDFLTDCCFLPLRTGAQFQTALQLNDLTLVELCYLSQLRWLKSKPALLSIFVFLVI